MNLAIFWPNWVGDAVMATPAVRALRDHFRQASFTHILRPYVAAILGGEADNEPQISFDRQGAWRHRWLAVAARLRAAKIDLAVIFPNSFRSALAAWLGRCCRRVGYARYA